MPIDLDDNAGDQKQILTISDDRVMLTVYISKDDLIILKNFMNNGRDYIVAGTCGNQKVYWSKDENEGASVMLGDLESSSVSIRLSNDEIDAMKLV